MQEINNRCASLFVRFSYSQFNVLLLLLLRPKDYVDKKSIHVVMAQQFFFQLGINTISTYQEDTK